MNLGTADASLTAAGRPLGLRVAAAFDLAARCLLAAGALGLLAWLTARGPMVAPISLYASASSTVGFYSASHIFAAMAALAALVATFAALRGRLALPAWPLLLGLALPLGAAALATAHAVYPHDARHGLLVLLAVALLYLALVPLLDGSLLSLALLATALGGCALAGVALHQFLLGQPTPVSWNGAAAAAIPVRAAATLHNPNLLAAMLLLCLGPALSLAVAGGTLPLRLLALALEVPLSAALTLTFSRGAYLGLAVAALATLALAPAGRRLRALAALAVVAAAVLAVSGHVPGVVLRAHTIGIRSAGDTPSRFFTWIDALQIWHAHPWTGAGPGGLETLYAAVAPRGWLGTFIYTVVPSSADNDLLQWLAETGAAGLALLAAGGALALFALALALRRQDADGRALAVPLLGVLAGIALQGCFEVTAYTLPVQALLAWICALLTVAAGCVTPMRLRWSRALALPATAGCLTVALGLWSTWAPFAQFRAAYTPFAAGHPELAVAPLVRAAGADPTSQRAHGAAGDAAVLAAYRPGAEGTGALEETARVELAAALRLDPFDGSVWSVAAALADLLKQPLAAACAQQAAVHTRPYDPFLAYELGRRLEAIGQSEAGAADVAYAAWAFPPTLAVMREHGDTGDYYQIGQQEQRQALNEWGQRALPHAPEEPLQLATCKAALAGVGMPGDAFATAIATGPVSTPSLGPAAPLAHWLERLR